MINTGGIKVLPEAIEKQLNKHLQGVVLFVDKIPDNKSGEKIIVITNKIVFLNSKYVGSTSIGFVSGKTIFKPEKNIPA